MANRGQVIHTVCHQFPDIVVQIMAANVVPGQFQVGPLMQFLKCGAVAHQAKVDVVVCKAMRQIAEVMLLKVQQLLQAITLHYVPADQIVADQSKVIMLGVTLMFMEHQQD
tara:strand:+ start:270 stop:602 length:333 start_codon:yes stop_codon:yes gene_type:complete